MVSTKGMAAASSHCFEVYSGLIWVVVKIRGTILGVPIIRTIVFWGLYWGPLNLGNYHIEVCIRMTSGVYQDV